ncbi:class F sortase [Xylanimonas allomyrinae]|uniref:class F sortase n=1 Tax=Xylanimonas allomyrinae TaxID=2509459 RepID=UPI0013A68389|nr:class F sortase [Xylanimonas allomyrinae]
MSVACVSVVVAACVLVFGHAPKPDPVAAASPTASATPAAPLPTATSLAFGQAPQLTISSLGIDAPLHAYTAEEAAQGYDEVAGTPCLVDGRIVCIDPVDLADVVWQQGASDGVLYGAAPSAQAQQNVYLFGHADATGTAIFSRIGELAAGDTIEITTSAGPLTYDVHEVITVGKDGYTSLPKAVEQVPGRLLLVTCDHRAGAALTGAGYAEDNIVVLAQLETTTAQR